MSDASSARGETFGERLSRLLEGAGYTNNVLIARDIGVSDVTVSRLRNDKIEQPTAAVVRRLARLLDVSIDYLLDGTDPEIDVDSAEFVDWIPKEVRDQADRVHTPEGRQAVINALRLIFQELAMDELTAKRKDRATG